MTGLRTAADVSPFPEPPFQCRKCGRPAGHFYCSPTLERLRVLAARFAERRAA